MNPNVPSIEQLQEIALPAPISYAPQTWGWWVLLAALVMTALLLGARRYWQWRRDRYRREALVRLAQLHRRSDDLSALRELPELLKRVALSMPSRHNTLAVAARWLGMRPQQPAASSTESLPQSPAALDQQAWQAYLQHHLKQPLPANFSQQMALLAYAPESTLRALPAAQRQQLFETCKVWVERHHVAA